MTSCIPITKHTKRIDNFLNELTALSIKYGIVVEACGCCHSPYLVTIGDEEKDGYKYVFLESGNQRDVAWEKRE